MCLELLAHKASHISQGISKMIEEYQERRGEERRGEERSGAERSFLAKFFLNVLFIFIFPDQLSRLHMILKPFMLRRIKCDVENELSEKVRCSSPFLPPFLTIKYCMNYDCIS